MKDRSDTKRSTLHLKLPAPPNAGQMTIRDADADAIDIYTSQARPGQFSDHTYVRLSHAQAVQVYLWLGEVVGREVEG